MFCGALFQRLTKSPKLKLSVRQSLMPVLFDKNNSPEEKLPVNSLMSCRCPGGISVTPALFPPQLRCANRALFGMIVVFPAENRQFLLIKMNLFPVTRWECLWCDNCVEGSDWVLEDYRLHVVVLVWMKLTSPGTEQGIFPRLWGREEGGDLGREWGRGVLYENTYLMMCLGLSVVLLPACPSTGSYVRNRDLFSPVGGFFT